MDKQKIKITLVKSVIDSNKRQKENVRRLGLNKVSSSVIHESTPQILGMVKKVEHLVCTENV